MTAVTLRLAEPAQTAAIARLSRDRIEHGLGWSWTPTRVMRSLQDPQTNVVVAWDGEAMLGFGIMRYREDDAHLLLLAVHAARCRRGVGTALVAWLERVAVVAGVSRISLEVRAGNLAAQAFYARLGFGRVRELPGYYNGIEPGVRLAKELGAMRVGPG